MQVDKEELYNNRPTSPHLTIYKPQITSVLSIMHRMTGVALFFGFTGVAWWLILFSFHDASKCLEHAARSSATHCLIYYPLSYAFVYHFCNGIKYLIWDMGYGYEKEDVAKAGWVVIVISILLTIILWNCIGN